MSSLESIQILGAEGSVYPGHPVTIAYLITQIYPSYDEAFDKPVGHQYCNALADARIPGAGGNVISAMRLLRDLREGCFESWDAAMQWADTRWADCDDQATGGWSTSREGWKPQINNEPCTPSEYYLHRWQSGQDQADGLKSQLREQESWWSNAEN